MNSDDMTIATNRRKIDKNTLLTQCIFATQ